MNSIIVDLLIISVLVLLNGFFSCAEFAIVSLRKSRLAQMIEEGDPRALIIESLQRDPHRLLAVVQIGVTLVGSFASAFGGVVAVQVVKPLLLALPYAFIHEAAEPLSVSLVVLAVSYVSLVLGELVPKAIGLHHAEAVALRVAYPIQLLARIAAIGVTFLTFSSRLVLKLLRITTEGQGFVSREEVQQIVAEGQETGVFTEAEHEYIKNIFDFTHTCLREVMVPRTRMVALDLELSEEQVLQIVLESQYSRYPVYRGELENIVGFIHGKDFLGGVISRKDFSIERIIRPPFFVPEGKKVNELLEQMQRERFHMALVVDEYGGISGLVTTEDLLEELVGEIEDEHDVGEPDKVLDLGDGVFVVDALISIADLSDLLSCKVVDDASYDTLAGLILDHLGRFPEEGEVIEWCEYRFVCIEVTKTAIQKVRVEPVVQES